jgi:hypothetical protein
VKLQAIFLIAISLLLSACGKSSELREPTPDDQLDATISGPIGENVAKLLDNQWAESCDSAQRSMRLEIAHALDDRKDEIDAFARKVPSVKNYERVDIGPLYARTLTTPFIPRKGWQEAEYGWGEAYDYFRKILREPVNRGWLWLQKRALSLTVNDKYRISDGMNMYLVREDLPLLPGILKKLKQTAKNPYAPVWTAEEDTLLHRNAYYSWHLRKLEKTSSDGEIQGVLESFTRRVEADVARYKFRKNEDVLRSHGELRVSMDPGPFEGYEEVLAPYIEDVWKKQDLRLKVSWKSRTMPGTVFRFVLESIPGGRAFMTWSDRTVHLYQETAVRAIAHEVGHVLGLRDQYYTVWDNTKCSYRDQLNDEEIMSVSEGAVSDDDWRLLEKNYPYRSPPN